MKPWSLRKASLFENDLPGPGRLTIKKGNSMIYWIISKLRLESNSGVEPEYLDCISDLICNEKVKAMKSFMQHGETDCMAHSLYVSYISYLACRRLGFDFRSAARGGLLHDFFLYDWHREKPYKGLHGFRHPGIALKNADRYFSLNKLEKEIIIRHMWPMTIIPPVHKEAYVVLMADKYCSFMESTKLNGKKHIQRLQLLLPY